MQDITEQCLTIGLCIIATQLSRFLPFALFAGKRKLPKVISYLGKALPAAVFGMILVYCCKDVTESKATSYAICIALTAIAHILFRNMMISIGLGTALYMLLVNTICA
ncbi:MAG: branched-chain amino acid transporter permease [Succinivibrio sp.]